MRCCYQENCLVNGLTAVGRSKPPTYARGSRRRRNISAVTKAQQMTHRLLRLKPAADYMSMSTWTLRRLIQQGELPVIQRENAPWLVDVEDLNAWIERSKQRLT